MEMNWHQALQESLSWLAIASFITLVCFTAAATLAVRCTRWGSQFWQLAGPYFSFRRSWRPLLVFALLLVLTLFSVRLNVLFSFWYNGFYSALQGLDQAAFWYLLGVFAVLATIHVLRSLFTFYVSQAFSIQWRVWLTERLTHDWMHGDAYYRGQFLAEPVDNPDQRIELDVNAFVSNSVTLALGAVECAGFAGGVHRHPLGAVGAAGRCRCGDSPGYGVCRVPLRHRRHLDRLPPRATADPPELPQRKAHRQLPLRADASARKCREHRFLPGAGTAGRAGSLVP